MVTERVSPLAGPGSRLCLEACGGCSPQAGTCLTQSQQLRFCFVIPISSFRFRHSDGGIGRFAARASGLALPVGSAEAPRARVGPEDAFCGTGFAERLERIFGCPCGWRGRPGQCAAFRPGDGDIFTAPGPLGARVTGWLSCWRARQRDTAGTASGRSPGCRVRQPPRRRACVRRTRRKLPPRNGETPGEPRPPTAGHPGRSSRLNCSRPPSLFTSQAVRLGAPEVRP